MENKKQKQPNTGLITLMVCGVVAVVLIVACVFFPDVIFGFLTK